MEDHLSLIEKRGLAATVAFGFFSTVMSGALLLYVVWVQIWRSPTRSVANQPQSAVGQGRRLTPIAIFYMSLLFWGSFQGIGWITSIPWILDSRVTMGRYCVAQAVIKQLSTSGQALSIIAMSWCIFHDHVMDVMTPLDPRHGYFGLIFIFLVQAGNIAIPNIILHGAFNYYGVAGYWCWINNDHFTTKIVTHYLWYWTAGLVSLLTALAYSVSARYGRLQAGFLWVGIPVREDQLLRIGLFSVVRRDDPYCPIPGLSTSWSLDIGAFSRIFSIMLPIPFHYVGHRVAHNTHQAPDRAFANRLLWFPISYLVIITPQSVVRFRQFHGKHDSPKLLLVAATLLAMTGAVDVLLFFWAKPAFDVIDRMVGDPGLPMEMPNQEGP